MKKLALMMAVALGAFAPSLTSAAETAAGACPSAPSLKQAATAPHWNGWGVDAAQHRSQPAGSAGLSETDIPKLKLKWAFGFPGAFRLVAQPTVFGGVLLIASEQGQVYALDAKTGCQHWKTDLVAGARASVVVGQSGETWVAYVADNNASLNALDLSTGKLLWSTKLDLHPTAHATGAPLLVGDILYVPLSSSEELIGSNPKYPCCSFRGSLTAVNAASGAVLWKTYTIQDEPKPTAPNASGVMLKGPSGAAIWASPTYDALKKRIYVATGDNYSDPPTGTSDAIMALDAATGVVLWVRQMTQGDAYTMACPTNGENCPKAKGPDVDFGASVILVSPGGNKRILLAGQKSGVVTALDPDAEGAVLWQKKVGEGGPLGGIEWGMAANDETLFVANSDLRLSVVAPGTSGSQPVFYDPKIAFLLDNKIGGGLIALAADSGEKRWVAPHPGCADVPGCSPSQSAAVTLVPGAVFSGGMDGHMRAYSAKDGSILWDADTKQEYKTTNAVAAKGGSLDGGGPVVVDGYVYFTSGAAAWGGVPGNVLLAYTVDGK